MSKILPFCILLNQFSNRSMRLIDWWSSTTPQLISLQRSSEDTSLNSMIYKGKKYTFIKERKRNQKGKICTLAAEGSANLARSWSWWKLASNSSEVWSLKNSISSTGMEMFWQPILRAYFSKEPTYKRGTVLPLTSTLFNSEDIGGIPFSLGNWELSKSTFSCNLKSRISCQEREIGPMNNFSSTYLSVFYKWLAIRSCSYRAYCIESKKRRNTHQLRNLIPFQSPPILMQLNIHLRRSKRTKKVLKQYKRRGRRRRKLKKTINKNNNRNTNVCLRSIWLKTLDLYFLS